MKNFKVAIFKFNKCAGCRLCELACEFGRDAGESAIKILDQPIIGSPIPIIRDDCDCSPGNERCVEFCSKGILKFVKQNEVAEYIFNGEWTACPLLPPSNCK